jgi:hypothetical protein
MIQNLFALSASGRSGLRRRLAGLLLRVGFDIVGRVDLLIIMRVAKNRKAKPSFHGRMDQLL